MSDSDLSTFGQELYLEASVQAVRLALQTSDRAQLKQRLMAALPQPSPKTRESIANKLIQRLIPTPGGQVQITPLMRLLAGSSDRRTREELVFYAAARADRVIAAIATEILYPWLVRGRPPAGYSQAEFSLANTAELLEGERVVTRPFVSRYARERWNFASEATLSRALRALAQAGLIQPLVRTIGQQRQISFARLPAVLTLASFVFCFQEELGSRPTPIALDQVQNAFFARLFLLDPLQVTALLEQARRASLLRAVGAGARRRFAPVHPDLSQLVETLLARQNEGGQARQS